ncbi:MAG: prolyl oligopeptidase family serine peptidase [Firmicutes bacterium]|nr:prolyl oligopeptidase family serine peptidase [Bacillota bacterium]
MSNLPPRPTTRRELVVENFHGTPVADPYRWLEDDTAPEVQEWMASQNADFESYVSGHEVREQLRTRLTDLWHYNKAGLPSYHAGYYYTLRNDGLQNQHVLYRSANLHDIGEVVIDPNELSEDGTVAMMDYVISPKGNYMAYSLSKSGSDWQTIRVLDLNTKENCTDFLQHMKFSSTSWLADESGFFYNRYPEPTAASVLQTKAQNSMVCLHMLGQEQSRDRIIHQDPENPDWDFYAFTDHDKKWLFLHVRAGSTLRRNKLFYKPLTDVDSPWLPIASEFVEGGYSLINVANDVAYISTQNEAPFGKVLGVKLSETGALPPQVVIPDQGEMLNIVVIADNKLLCSFLHHATNCLKLYDLNGEFLREITLPSVGSVPAVSADKDRKEIFIQFSGFLFPSTILRYDFTTEETTTWFAPDINFPFDEYQTVQVFAPSKDGTKVPLFITHRKNIKLDGNNPTVLYGYGGFNISITPNFSVSNLVWLEKGGVFVQACLRGGDEYGEAWHRAGMLESKQNVFDDFISAGEYLIREKYTSREKLGIVGRSNGGLLTGACLTQRPDFFGAVVVWVPVLDMLRYHHFTSGRYWVGEYGCAENPEQFEFLYKYSPLHNVKMNTVYPPTLVMTADTDDRVVPGQARKFAATLQAADGGENPILIRIESSAGHGAGKPVGKVIAEQTDMYTFFSVNLK